MTRLTLLILTLAASTVFSAAALAQSDTIFDDGFESPDAAGCPATISSMPGGPRSLQTYSDISYGVWFEQSPKRQHVDLSEWNNIWGHATVIDGVTPWPGVTGSFPAFRQFGRYSYVGAHFRTPAASQLTGLSGKFYNSTSSIGGPSTIMSISTVCGDFSEHLPSPGCLVDHSFGDPPGTGVPTDGSQMVFWKFTSSAPLTSCNLEPNTDYYVNIIQADPLSTRGCPAGSATCGQSPESNWGAQ